MHCNGTRMRKSPMLHNKRKAGERSRRVMPKKVGGWLVAGARPSSDEMRNVKRCWQVPVLEESGAQQMMHLQQLVSSFAASSFAAAS